MDGFNEAFFHMCWQIVKVDVIEIVQSLFKEPRVLRGFNSNFIALIPKQDNPLKVNHF